jgi:hypothetical protein
MSISVGLNPNLMSGVGVKKPAVDGKRGLGSLSASTTSGVKKPRNI